MLDYQAITTHPYGLIQDAQTVGVPAFVDAPAIVPAALREMPGLMPRLVAFEQWDIKQRVEALASLNQQALDGEDPWTGLLMQSSHTPDRLAGHLKSRMVIDIAGMGPCFFRFFDPRVLVQLPWMLDAAQLAWMCGPVEAFLLYLDGEWRTVKRPEAKAAPRLLLRPEQSFALSHVQPMNEVLAEHGTLSADVRIRLGQAVMAHFRTAAALGLTALQDQKAFARHAQSIHPEFHRHEQVQACLSAMDAEDDHPYLAATQDLDDEAWARIRADMNRLGESDGR